MRELHAIGLTPDGQHLLFAATPDATKASHRIAVDQRFEAVLRGQRLDDSTSGPTLSVQDMQAKLRSGATVEEVAAAAGLPVSRVERFAGPILSEREAVLRKVFAAHQSGRRGRSTVPLGRAVAIALEGVANVRLDTVDWTAYRKADGVWVGCVSVFARGRVRRAEWSLDDVNRTVRPLDAWASSLGHIDDAVKPAPAAPSAPDAAGRALKKPTPKPGTPKVVTFKAAPAKNRAAPAKLAKAAPARAAKAAPAKLAKAAKAAPGKLAKAAPVRAAKAAKAAPAKAKTTKAATTRAGAARGARATPVKAARAPAKTTRSAGGARPASS